MIHPPGTILQRLYVRERLRAATPGSFIEIGAGEGHWARLLLDLGWRGTAYEPGIAFARARRRLGGVVKNEDFLSCRDAGKADLIFSSMVLEHLSEDDERRLLARCRERLAPGGKLVLLVPASPAHWGIEDEIAGHLRRFTAESLRELLAGCGWSAEHLAGLTYPLSNWLLPLSDLLVARAECSKLGLSREERTSASGLREVPMKTRFPSLLAPLLNEAALRPLHWLQKRFLGSPAALVLYAECVPRSS